MEIFTYMLFFVHYRKCEYEREREVLKLETNKIMMLVE